MIKLLTRTSILFASAALFAAGLISQSNTEIKSVAPTSLTVIVDDSLASGPTLPPGDYDEDEDGGTKVASGPTLPPGDYDEDEDGGTTKVASGPTLPPGDYDDEDPDSGDTKVA